MARVKFKFSELDQLVELAFVPAVIDEETGEILQEEFVDEGLLDEAGEVFIEKAEGILLASQMLDAESKAIKEKIRLLSERAKQKERRAEKLREFMKWRLNGEPFETDMVKVVYRKTQRVEVEPEAISFLPAELQRVKTTYEADKAAIKKRLKAGEVIEGCTLVDSVSMSIK